jgi:hypothetical protein
MYNKYSLSILITPIGFKLDVPTFPLYILPCENFENQNYGLCPSIAPFSNLDQT